MSEQEEEVEVIQYDSSLPRQLLSPLNYLEEFAYSCCPPLSPQYSSGSDLRLWDFSADCINSHSTRNTQFPNLPSTLVGWLNNERTDLLATCKIIDGTLPSVQFRFVGTANNSLAEYLTTCKIIGDTRSWEWFAIGDRLYEDYLGYLLPCLNSVPWVKFSGCYMFAMELDSTGTSTHVFFDKLKVGDFSRNRILEEVPKLLKNSYKNYILAQLKGKRVVDDKLASRIESIPTYQTNNATLGPEALQNGEESGKTYSVEQQRVLKFDSGYDRRKVSDTRGKNPDPILKKARDRITFEDLQQLFGLPLNDAAKRLGFSRSTLKRSCREHDIPRWPSHKKKRINVEQNIEHVSRSVQEAERALASQQREASVEAPHPVPEAPQFVQQETPGRGNTIENIDTVEEARNLHAPRAKERVLESSKTIPPDSYPPQNKLVESFPSTNPSMQVAAVQDTRKITIKARYMDDIIKFRLSSSSGIAELQEEVTKRLSLRLGEFKIKYLDIIEQDWVLIACNEDLQDCLTAGTGAIQMSIQSK